MNDQSSSSSVKRVTGGCIKKAEVVTIAIQTEHNNNYKLDSSTFNMSFTAHHCGVNMVDRIPTSNAAEQRALANRTPNTSNRAQPGSSEGTSEGTIVMTIGKFSTLSDTVCSGPKRIQGVPWRIMVMPKQHVVQKKQQKCMGFFLQCCPERVYSDAWSCKADAEMRLMSKKHGVNNFVRKTSHVYTSKENDWGYSCFMTWADVLDENQGYIKDDKITLEITVKAEAPKNLMSREEFVKAIDQWFNLAEMQMSRGMIDLSLEANAQGLKFCKDKDEEMRTKLEEQKQRLVKKKVLDSISRIENHGGQPKSSEPLKPTSLKQALTGAQKTIGSRNSKAIANKRDRKTLQQIKKKKQETVVKQQAIDDSTSDDCDDMDEEEDSDDYNEDEEAIDNQISTYRSDHTESLHGSTSSLETAISDKLESGCQTEISSEGKPQPNPRRERRPAGSQQGATPNEVAARFTAELRTENSGLYKKLHEGHEVTPADHDKIDAWCRQHFGDCSQDVGTCGLTIGLCAVTSRKCAEASRDFRKLITETFKEEALRMQKEGIDCGELIKKLLEDEEYQERNVLYPMSECERSVELLVQEMGQAKFDLCIAQKLQNMLNLKEYNTGLITLLTQLFNYFRTLTEQKYELLRSLEFAKKLFQIKTKNGGFAYKTQVIKDNEKRLQDSETLLKKMGQTYQMEAERNKKLESQLAESESKLKTAQQQIDQLTQQLKESRNLTKKAEKKSKQEEIRNSSLSAEKIELEDKLKASKKEFDQLKKKSTEERNNAKKQKDRDTEIIRRLENDNAEKEAEKEREKTVYEERLREAKTKENRAEKEKRQAINNTNAALERARIAEAAQISLMYELHQHRFDKAKEEISTGICEAEKNLKRVHNTQVDQDTMKKNLAEWKAVSDELEQIIKETKTEYDNAADIVKKGQVLYSHLELSQPTLPTLPKTIRLPPVQVVQPSTSAIPPPTIVTPPAGVIGQPRVSNPNAGVIGQPSRHQVSTQSSINGSMPGPSFSSMKINHSGENSSQSHSQSGSIINPASSLWNWSSGLENVTASVFRPSSMDPVRAQPSQNIGVDNWGHHDEFSSSTLNRTMYTNQQGQPVSWANGWQRPGSASMAPQSQYRPGLPPYYQ